MKKITIVLLCIILITVVFPLAINADTGPKPSVVIDFTGLEGQTYYVTLLSSVESTGPFSALSDSNNANRHYEEGDEDYDIFLKFAEYKDCDGFYFLQFFKNCTQTHQFSWTYYPPQVFKILVYFPETDSFIVSDATYERYAFDSYFTAELTGTGLSAYQSYKYSGETLSLVLRILLTIAIELVIALLFGYRAKKQILIIMLVNLVTQISLNLGLNAINYKSGAMAFIVFYVLLEIAVFITEAVLYSWYLKKHSPKELPAWKPTVYALTANAFSFALGVVLAYWIPGMF